MQILDSWISSKIAELNNELVPATFAVQSGYFDAHSRVEAMREELERLSAIATWYTAQVNTVLNMTGGPQQRSILSLRVGRRRDLDEDYEESAAELLERLRRSHADLGWRLKTWVNLLIERGQLTREQAAALNLQEPKHVAYVARQEAERKERQQFEQGFEELRRAVKDYAKKTGASVGWGERDFLSTWNKGAFSKDERGLLAFAHALGERKLLPFGDRFANSWRELIAKLKGVLA